MLKRGRGITRILSPSGIRLSGPQEGSRGTSSPQTCRGPCTPRDRPFQRIHRRPQRVTEPSSPGAPHRLIAIQTVAVPFLCRSHGCYPCPVSGPWGRGVCGVSSPLPATSGEGRKPLPRPLSLYNNYYTRLYSFETRFLERGLRSRGGETIEANPPVPIIEILNKKTAKPLLNY